MRKKTADPRRHGSAKRAPEPQPKPEVEVKIREIGGPQGPEPTRYGDWEKGGRCSDF
ncbi:MAG: DUF1674 domain-containing protein [Xanthomonadales bacterium]|nr:DUF1674 domain-containing protein [Xanthomonadales bacterium]NIN73804.1 DUF1674 domain-containing protein [Xanthomonadales bacterium]NIP10908.1 DUF1674 domain-containing protein [Xanthomonadales bacterium]NIT07212.1 DUF1674 domain-containing protein [Xanthomonadales bacterium]NIT32688.1 DUF1674 domain-containing protein [Xanthomonadales bacterium]